MAPAVFVGQDFFERGRRDRKAFRDDAARDAMRSAGKRAQEPSAWKIVLAERIDQTKVDLWASFPEWNPEWKQSQTGRKVVGRSAERFVGLVDANEVPSVLPAGPD